jgi:hypothetical protein
MDLPKLCMCGNPVEYSNEDRCEDCFVTGTMRYHGRSQRVKSVPWLEGEDEVQVQDR